MMYQARRKGPDVARVGVRCGVVALVALTLVFVTLIGQIASGHMWIGALVVGVFEVALGVVVMRRGVAAFKQLGKSG